LGCGHLDYREQFFQQRSEFQFGEESAQASSCRFASAHGIDVEFDGHVRVDGRHTLAEENRLAIVLQRLAVGFLFNFGGALQRLLDRAEALDDLDRTLVADAGSARECCRWRRRAAPSRRSRVQEARREFPQPWPRRKSNCLSADSVSALVVDQLHHVFVAGDDVDGMRSFRGFAGERADHVVGLESGETSRIGMR
jgi:hypothetical protein